MKNLHQEVGCVVCVGMSISRNFFCQSCCFNPLCQFYIVLSDDVVQIYSPLISYFPNTSCIYFSLTFIFLIVNFLMTVALNCIL